MHYRLQMEISILLQSGIYRYALSCPSYANEELSFAKMWNYLFKVVVLHDNLTKLHLLALLASDGFDGKVITPLELEH